MPRYRFDDKTKWNVSQENRPDGNGPCISYLSLDKEHYISCHENRYTLIAETATQRDADMVCACRNHDWDEAYISYLERFRVAFENYLKGGKGSVADAATIKEMLTTLQETRNPKGDEIFRCFGNCDSLQKNKICKRCYSDNHRVWVLCAAIRIQKDILAINGEEVDLGIDEDVPRGK